MAAALSSDLTSSINWRQAAISSACTARVTRRTSAEAVQGAHACAPPQLIHTGDHGIHDLHVADGAGAQHGAELRLENIHALEAEPDRAPSEEGIELLGHVQRAHEFVAPQVERANDDV